MPRVEFTSHLHHLFPALAAGPVEVVARTVAEVVAALDERAPGLAFYLCDELGRLRQHVLIYVGDRRVKDRATLTDPVDPDARVLVVQALSGG